MRRDPHILVVENAPLVRHKILYALQSAGFRDVDRAETGTKALAMIEARRPGVVIIGSDLHDTTTLLFALQIRMTRALRGVRLIMVSHRRSHEDIVTAIRCGIDNYVALPFPNDVLADRVMHAVVHPPDDDPPLMAA